MPSIEFKDIFDLIEIDESSDFLRLKLETDVVEENWETFELSDEETIFIPNKYCNISLSDLKLSIRLKNVLQCLNIEILGDLHRKSYHEIKITKNCGRTTINELRELIERLDDSIKGETVETTIFTSAENKKIFVPESLENIQIVNTEISVRLTNILDKLGIVTLGNLRDFCIAEIKNTKSCGNKTIDELKNLVEKFQDDCIKENFEKRQNQQITHSDEEKISILHSLKNVLIDRLSPSLRLTNVLKELGVETIGDLERYSIKDIKRSRNFGKKSLKELRSLINGIGPTLTPDILNKTHIEELPNKLDLNGLIAFFNTFMRGLSERDREIFLDRFGGAPDERIPTLEELGEKFSVTRERVRQIESSIFKKLKNQLGGISENTLKKVKYASEAAVCPVSKGFLIHLIGNDYDLFDYPPNFYLYLLKKLSPEIFIYTGSRNATQIDKNVSELIQKMKSILDDEVHFLTLAQIFERMTFFNQLSIKDFFQAILDENFIIEAGDSLDVLLIASNKNNLTMAEMAWQVLRNSERPLLPEEIIEEAKKMFGAETEIHSERSFSNLPSYDQRFYLLDRRTIGLRHHFKLPEEKWGEVTDNFYKLLSERQRPVSTTEVINEHLFEWTVQTTPGEATEILREDSRFKDLGRFLFALSEWEIEEREPVKDLVVRVLLETDDALTATEIGEQIQKYRSVSMTSMATILREHPDLKIFDFGSGERMRLTYYGLKTKSDYRKFFATSEIVLKRLVNKFSPIKFGDLCEKLYLSADDELAEKLWQTLQKIPELRFTPVNSSPETVIKFSRWHLKSH